MQLELDDEERRWRDQIRDFADTLDAEWMHRTRAELDSTEIERYSLSFEAELAGHGWIGLSLPEPYGRAVTPTSRFAFQEELEVQGLPSYGLTQNEGSAHQLLAGGSDELIAEHLPKLVSGTWRYAGGLSEPEAGSDLFALRTTAVRDGDHYVVNGAKLWTSGAHLSHWISTVVRTTPGTGPKGLSILMISTELPGVTIQPVHLLGGWRVNACFFDDVRVPIGNRIGEEGQGLAVLVSSLEKERAMSFGGTETRLLANRLVHRLEGCADELGDDALVALGRFIAELEADRMLYLRVATQSARGEDTTGTAPMNKVFGSELAQRFAQFTADVLGQDTLWAAGDLAEGDDVLAADAEQQVRTATVLTIIGGTSEIQRNAVAARHLGLPKAT